MKKLNLIGVGLLISGLICLLSGVTAALPAKYNEAPMLRVKVAAGTLPSVEERLPDKPLVVQPLEEIGQYGGTWKMAQTGLAAIFTQDLTVEPLVYWNRSGSDVVPNVAEKWDTSKDYRTYTFYLRKGIKWSDGVPLTVDDILFWYEDVLLNEELTPVFPSWLTTGGEPVKIEKVDNYTVRFQFTQPYVKFLETMILGAAQYITSPKHYLKEFHPRYIPKEQLDRMVKEEGFDAWYALFGNKNDRVRNPDYPNISPWLPTAPLTGAITMYVLERNPYYWKVDPEGNQLPYIDRIANTIVESPEVLLLKAVAGELDMQFTGLTLFDYPILMENREKENYRVLRWPTAYGSSLAFMPNLNCKDPVLKKLFSDRRFRIALSVAIDREEINEFCYLGLAEPRHATVVPGCPYYEEDLSRLYAEYDFEKANEILDEIGLSKRNKEGFRLRPDGKVLALTIDYVPIREHGPWDEVVSLVVKYWKAIGIKAVGKSMERSLFVKRRETTDPDMVTWAWGRGTIPLFLPIFVFPSHRGLGAPLYAEWYLSGGKSGEKPTGDILKAMELYDRYKVSINPEERLRLGKELIRLSAESIWMIGTVGLAPKLTLVKNNFRNVPEENLYERSTKAIGKACPEQFYIKK